jgi:hypothetical protein
MLLPDWLTWLERRVGSWAIPHAVKCLAIFQAVACLLEWTNPGFAESLWLDPTAVAAGEYWRLATFLFVPRFPAGLFGVLFLFFFVSFLWTMSDGLESQWGSFVTSFYVFLNAAGIVAVSLLWPGQAGPHANFFIFLTIVLAFATLYPDFEILLIPVPIPVRIKWIGWFSAALCLLQIPSQPGLSLVSLATYAAYAVPGIWYRLGVRRALKRRKRKKKPAPDESDPDSPSA